MNKNLLLCFALLALAAGAVESLRFAKPHRPIKISWPILKLDRCSQPKVKGPCKAHHKRFFFDTKSNKCKKFHYGGCKGNSNNFKSKHACDKACPKKHVDRCSQPKKVGHCRARHKRFFYDKKANKCKHFFFGGCKGNQNNFKTKHECDKACFKKPVDRCSQPKKVGHCRARHRRFFYDKKANKCRKFHFGGCGGNQNNFKSKHACDKACFKKPVDTCDQPKKVGHCRARHTRFFYDKKANKCKKFHFGGCGGNKNNFKTQQACIDRCFVDVCELPKRKGPCHKRIARFFYDPKKNECKRFRFGGCKGNGNNFKTKHQCENQCVIEYDDYYYYDDDYHVDYNYYYYDWKKRK